MVVVQNEIWVVDKRSQLHLETVIFEGPAPWEEVTPRLNYGTCWLRIYKKCPRKFLNEVKAYAGGLGIEFCSIQSSRL